MTCPACGGTDAEDGPGCVCQRRPAGHAPGVIPGVPVLTDVQADHLGTMPRRFDAPRIGNPAALYLRGLVAVNVTRSRLVLTTLGRRALSAHRLGLATRASFTIDTGAL